MKTFTKYALFGMAFIGLTLGATSCRTHYKPLLSSNTGINFQVVPFKKGLELANSTHKPLFVFAHASWCPTCKKEEQEVFVQKELGDSFNRDFINIAIDIDSPDGHKLNEAYPIKATPTLFYFKADGSLVKKTEGFVDAKKVQADAILLTR